MVLLCMTTALMLLGSCVSLVQWTQKNVISGILSFPDESHADVSLSPLLKGIHVTNRTENENSHLASNESIAIFHIQNCRERQCHIDWHARPQNMFAGENARAFLDAKFCAGPRMNVESEKSIEVMCWRLSSILNFDFRYHSVINFEMVNRGSCYKDICSKLPLGMYLARLPKQVVGNEQTNGEHGHYKRANSDNLGVIFSDESETLLDKAAFYGLLVFFFTGALIGFGLQFLNAWVGRCVLIGWLILFLYILSGLWLNA
jgi:hypothetical protein